MAEKVPPGKKTLEDLGWNPTPGIEVLGLFHFWQHFARKRRPGAPAYAAFEALGVIGRSAENIEGRELPPDDPNTKVCVPWWIVKVLAMQWASYRQKTKRMGEAFGVERTGRGHRRAGSEFDLLHRNLMLALDVHHQREANGLSLEDAIAAVARGLGEELDDPNLTREATVRRAYRKFDKTVRAAYQRHYRENHEERSS